MSNQAIWVEKKQILNSKIAKKEIPQLQKGEVLMEIEKFALTTNNITYAVTGLNLNYWDFFPASEPYGVIPVWGFGIVKESRHNDIQEGDRYYGYYPMGEQIIVQPGKVTPMSFRDMAAHRQPMARIYNTYTLFGKGGLNESFEDYVPIFKPLFTTSFLNYHFLRDESFFEAKNVIITSASSKTSLGLAYMYDLHKEECCYNVIGLTSPRNKAFVEQTGFYDDVITYDQATDQLAQESSILVDMSGNAQLLLDIYGLLGDELRFISRIGLTDWTASSMEGSLPIAKFFFAPAYAEIFFKKHGVEEANRMINEEMASFIYKAQEWIRIEYITSFDHLQKKYLGMVKGDVDPSKGYILKVEKDS